MSRRTAYGAAVAELRQKVKDARAKARQVRAEVLKLIATCKARHKQWIIDERARHRAALVNARAQLKLTEKALRQSGKVEAHLHIQNAIDALQAVRDEHLRDRLDRARRHADDFRENEAGIAFVIDGDPILLDVWKRARADVRRRYETSRKRGMNLDPVEAWNEHLHDTGSDISEAKARIHHTTAREAELEIRELTRQWKAGTLDESMGEACKHARAVKSLDGSRSLCPDCGQSIAITKKKPKKKPANMGKLRHRAKVRKRDRGQTMNTPSGMVWSLRKKKHGTHVPF